MVAFESMSYTSLKDMLPESPLSMVSPTSSRIDSWREIPIKDPLVQHAAWAYLQPMAVGDEDGYRCWFFRRVKDKCCGLFGCFNDVVLVMMVKTWFSEHVEVEDKNKSCGF